MRLKGHLLCGAPKVATCCKLVYYRTPQILHEQNVGATFTGMWSQTQISTFIAFFSLPRDKFLHTGPPVLGLIEWHPQVGKNRKKRNTALYWERRILQIILDSAICKQSLFQNKTLR